MWQIIQAIIIYTWLFAVLVLLGIHAIRSSMRQQRLQDALIEATHRSADAAQKAADAAQTLALYLKREP